MTTVDSFFLLTLSHNKITLFKGDEYGLVPVPLAGFSKPMEKILNIDEYPKSSETHAIKPAGPQKGSEAFHGHYNVSQTDKIMLQEYFRRVNRRLRPVLLRENLPLIIAGVNYLLPIYRRVNTYSNLFPQSLTGNFDRLSATTMHQKAWRLIKKSRRLVNWQ